MDPSRLMPCRVDYLHDAMAAKLSGAPPLVGQSKDAFYLLATSDDPGLYYFVPKVANALNMDVVDAAVLFLDGIAWGGFLVGAVGMCLLCSRWWLRLAATMALAALTWFAAERVGDLYVVAAAAPMALIPFALYACQHQQFQFKWLAFYLGLGLIAGMANQIRGHSGSGVLLFVAVLLLTLQQLTWRQRLTLAACALVGSVSISTFAGYTIHQRGDFVSRQGIDTSKAPAGHPFWHSVYIGLGYRQNKHGITYLDECAIQKVAELNEDADFLSEEYERTLRNEVFSLVRRDPGFIFTTIYKKSKKLAKWFLAFSSVGFLAALIWRKPWQVDLAFATALLFNSLFGVLVLPVATYCLGFLVLSAIYGLISIEYALQSPQCNWAIGLRWRPRWLGYR